MQPPDPLEQCLWQVVPWGLVPLGANPTPRGHHKCPKVVINFTILCSIVVAVIAQLLVLQLGSHRTLCFYPTALFPYVSSYCYYNYSTCEAVCFGASTTGMILPMASTCVELAAALGQHDVVLLPPVIPKGHDERCWLHHHCAAAATSIPDAF